jgi:hypothetical protein
MLVHLISAALLVAPGAIYHMVTVNKLKEVVTEKEGVIKALQLHSETLAKKRDQLVNELRVLTATKKTPATEFPIESAPVAKKKKVYKRKPKAKVEA